MDSSNGEHFDHTLPSGVEVHLVLPTWQRQMEGQIA